MSEDQSCSFCNKRHTEARRIIRGLRAAICDDCVELCYAILEEKRPKEAPFSPPSEAELIALGIKPPFKTFTIPPRQPQCVYLSGR